MKQSFYFLRMTLAWVFCLYFTLPSFSQNEKELIREIFAEDRTVVDALVMYPEDTRNDIFQISTHPELLIRIQSLQGKAKDRFLEIIEDEEQDEQEKFYEILRYKGLISDLGEGDKKSKNELNEILGNYPEEVHEAAKHLNSKKHEDLKEIYELTTTIKSTFQEMISGYPEISQEAARNLIEFPETLSLLTENMNLTILIGDLYKTEPEWVRTKADSLNLVIALQETEELEDFKKQLEEDPEAYQDMMAASKQYAIDNEIDNYDDEIHQDPTVHVTHHYSYWYGYPHWYASPLWAPTPWYYHTGFYYGPGGGVIFIGMPSPYYVGWHYSYYPNRYVHLNTHYHRHYHRHPYSHGSFHHSVNVNVNRNTNIIVNNREAHINNRNIANTSINRKNAGNKLENFDRNNINNSTKDRIKNADRSKINNSAKDRASNVDRSTVNKATKDRATNVDRNRKGNIDRDMAKTKTQSTRNRSNIEKKTSSSSYNRHKAYQKHSSSWGNSGSRTSSRSGSTRSRSSSTRSRSGGRRR